jgi:diguanylate cyclase (GGDEF)-like protein/PAS domain S-box-containing protein
MFHSLLKRQLKKNSLDDNLTPTLEQWQSFLAGVNRVYQETDQERYLLERSLAISSNEMREMFERLSESETRYALAAKGANDGLWDWNLETDHIFYSDRCLEILGVDVQTSNRPTRAWWFERIHPDDKDRFLADFSRHIKGETPNFHNEHQVLHCDGNYRWVLVRGIAVRDEQGHAFRLVGSLTDVTERKTAEEKLAHDATHDALTGASNRKFLINRLKRSLERMKLGENYCFAALFIDLDRFKSINDTMGHQVGDELLVKITQKLKSLIRPRDMLARLGGDEFVILVENASQKRQVKPIAERILRELQNPMVIDGQEIYISASIGIVFGANGYEKAEELIRDADLAMYRAKMKGKGRFEWFESQMHDGMLSRLQLEMDLPRAIERQEFLLHYQPIVDLDNETIVGFESLIRWQHPTRGFIPPNEFIPIAEETGIILSIGKWVLRESCRQMAQWQKLFPLADNLIISVNLSGAQLEQTDLTWQVQQILAESGLRPNCLKLEITESVIMKNAEQAIETAQKLRKMGVRISIDDFGTGYSSLSYLHRFPIETLKVDRSFINRIGVGDENEAIVQTIISLAENLGIDVVAEGIEKSEQLDFLRKIHCHYGQGFYYSRPIDTDSAGKILQELAVPIYPTVSEVNLPPMMLM